MREELFDIYDEELRPIGTAPRSEVHRQGYWHRTFHCWLTRREAERRYVLFQLRTMNKDTNPGCYDITAAGHLAAGETMREAVRELNEELGVQASFEQLIPLGQIREQAEGIVNGSRYTDREVSDVFALVTDAPLASLSLQPEEVAGVYVADLEQLLALFEGSLAELRVAGVEAQPEGGPLLHKERIVLRSQFVPRDLSYYVNTLKELRHCT